MQGERQNVGLSPSKVLLLNILIMIIFAPIFLICSAHSEYNQPNIAPMICVVEKEVDGTEVAPN